MRRSMNRGLSDDSHLPSLDDDLETLLNKAEAIFGKKMDSAPVQATRAETPRPAPMPVVEKPQQQVRPQTGLMQRQRSTQ